MSSQVSQVSACAADLQARLQSIAKLNNKNLFVFDEGDLLDKIKGAIFPAAGVVYEGMRALPESGHSKIGITAEVVFSILVLSRGENIANVDSKTPMLGLLDTVRRSIVSARSPTGQPWKFLVEAAVKQEKGVVFWVQRWSTIITIIA